MKFILIQVIDREISVSKFNYLQDAVNEMKKLFNEYNKNSTDSYLGNFDAWITDGAGNHDDIDFKIIRI